MKEFNYTGDGSILEIPNGDRVWGVTVPCTIDARYLVKILDVELNYFCKRHGLDKKLTEYTKEYGKHVFYLGTFKNKSGTLIKFFSFPVKEHAKDIIDATTIADSCADLTTMQHRFDFDVCIIPQLQEKDDLMAWVNCYRDMVSLLLDEHYVMVYRIKQ